MRGVILIFSLLLTLSSPLFGQKPAKEQGDVFTVLSAPNTKGQLIFEQNDEIKLLINKYIDYRKKENRLPGYRIRIFSNSGQAARQNARNERGRFLKLYPEIPAYETYEAPNFKIYVGDYRTKIEAFQSYKQIKREFRNAFLVAAKINLPKL